MQNQSIEKNYFEMVWEAYQLYAKTAAVRRKGFELAGMTEKTDDIVPDIAESFMARGESDLEHQAKVAWLALAFMAGPAGYRIIWPRGPVETWAIATVALCHDVGEVEIGDIPHDGNALHDTKDEIELKVISEMAEIYSTANWRRSRMLFAFTEFQNKTTPCGMALFALDKLESVLMQLLCEKHGCCGMITARENPTELDKYFMRMTKSEKSSDCWAAHTCSLIRDFPDWIKCPVLTLLDVAVRDVRGEPFAWWNKDILPYKNDK